MTKATKSARIEAIEAKMKFLFSLPTIDEKIVDAYNDLEKEWKHLKEHDMDVSSVIQQPKNKFEAIRIKEMLNLKTIPQFY